MTPMPFDRAWRAYLTEAKYELLRLYRTPAFLLPFLVAPVGLYLFFSVYIGGASPTPPPARYLFTGFAVFGLMGPGLFGFGVGIATERQQNLLTLRRALPMSGTAHLLAKMAMAALFGAAVMSTMLVAALTTSPLTLSLQQVLVLFALAVLGTLPFCAIGLLVGTLVSGKGAPGVVNLIYIPMIYLSNMLIPLPGRSGIISVASPAFHLNQLALAATGGTSALPPVMHVAVLAGVTVLCAGLAVRRLAQAG